MNRFLFTSRALPLMGVSMLLSSCGLAATTAPPSKASWPGWIAMPLLAPEAQKAGVFPGGEGTQWPRGPVVVSKSDPNFLLLPIDVGGIYRSLDGGAHWNPAMNGWNARGGNTFAIDPRNAHHVLGEAGNSMDWDRNWGPSPHGVYLSNDEAGSWKQVLSVFEGGGSALAFDPTSFDGAKKICTRAYFLSVKDGLFASQDGGATWKGVANVRATQSGLLRVDDKGTVFVGNGAGLWRSTDGGANWKSLRTQGVAGLDVVKGAITISGDDGLNVSRDGGATFSALPSVGIKQNGHPIQGITVSPADPKRMLCWVQGDNYQWVRTISQDGGATFSPIQIERGLANRDDGAGTSIAGGFSNMPINVREGKFAWHPINPDIVYGIGGDWVTRSTDGGKTFKWWNNGNNGVMLGSSFNFAAQDPRDVFLSFQDYNGANSTDGGATWTYHDVSGKGWGGFEYGGSQTTGGVMWAGDADGWTNPRKTRLSRDGGQTWNNAKDAVGKDCVWSGADVSYTDPKNADILFASNWRSTDKGISWSKMDACDGVYIASPDGTLFGRKGNSLVKSGDGGATWTTLADVPGGFSDVAFDAKRGRFYFASENRLKRLDGAAFSDISLPKDQKNNGLRAQTVAVDAGAPDVVYVGGPRDIYASHATIARSRDGGQTWENLSAGDGPHEVSWVRVNPQTGDAWLNGQCYGMWRIKRPTTLGAADPAHGDAPPMPTVQSVADLKAPTPAAVRDPNEPKISNIIADFGGRNFDYAYGDIWKVGGNISTGEDGGVGFVQIDSTEHGGAGLVLNGVNLAPQGQTHLALRARKMAGNAATQLAVNLNRADADGGGKTLTFDLRGLSEDHFSTVLVRLPDGDFSKVQQIQVQGTNWSGAAGPLKIQIDSLGTTTPDAALNAKALVARDADPANGPAPKDKPDVAGQGFYANFPQAWMAMHGSNVARTKQGAEKKDIRVVFLGDSITQGWGGEGKDIFDARYAPLGAVNYGIGGDSTRQVLWRITHGEFDGITPVLVVLKIGTNNLYGDGNAGTDEEIASGISKIVSTIRAKSSTTKVLLLGLLPRQNDYFSNRTKHINALIAPLDDGKTVRFLDLSDRFQTEVGHVKPELYGPDQLHLVKAGYQVWADAMQPLFDSMMK